MSRISSQDFLVDIDIEASRHEINFSHHKGTVMDAEVKNYTDAELYRIIVARALHEGRFQSKAEFDAAARQLGTIQLADELIAYRATRHGCAAWMRGDLMICECGNSWKKNDENPPTCKKAR